MLNQPRCGSTLVVVFIIVIEIVIIFVVLLVLVEVILVFFFFIFFFLVLFGLGPALRLIRTLEIHFVPRLEVDLLDIAIEILDLDELRVLIDGQYAERLFFF